MQHIKSFEGTSVQLSDLLRMKAFAKIFVPESKGVLWGNSDSGNRSGISTEFDFIRPLQQGDAMKHIDARATARSSNLMVRTYLQENQTNIKYFLDCSGSMQFGDRACTKLVAALQLLSLCCWASIDNQCSVDIYCFNSKSFNVIQQDISNDFEMKNALNRLLAAADLLISEKDDHGQNGIKQLNQNMLSGLRNNSNNVLFSDLTWSESLEQRKLLHQVSLGRGLYIVLPSVLLEHQTQDVILSIGSKWRKVLKHQLGETLSYLHSIPCYCFTHISGEPIPLGRWFD